MKHRRLSIVESVALCAFLSWLASFILMRVAHNTQGFRFAAILYILSIASIPLFLLVRKLRVFSRTDGAGDQSPYMHWSVLWGIVYLAVCSRFLLLDIYPFVALGDEVRDGGLNAVQILSGTIRNVFQFGTYESHGLIIPAMATPFFLLFRDSVLMYRIPAAIISVLDITALYIGVRLLVSPSAAFWIALILIGSPLHLFYGRTELVVILSSIATTGAILLLSYIWPRRISWPVAVVLGIYMGFGATLHTSARTVMVLMLGLCMVKAWADIRAGRSSVLYASVIFLITVGSVVAGFGPKILYSSPSILLQTRSIYAAPESSGTGPLGQFTGFLADTRRSLLIYVTEPTTSHFPTHMPLLRFPLAVIALLIGIVVAIRSGKPLPLIALLLGCAVPLTNSAITDCINCDHRLAPLLPISSILAGLGLSWCAMHIPNTWKRTKHFVIILFVIVCLYPGIRFFLNEEANTNRNANEYVSMHLVRYLQTTRTTDVCISGEDDFITFLELMHSQELYRYMLPDTALTYRRTESDTPGTIYVSGDCDLMSHAFRTIRIPCATKTRFTCPPGGSTDFIIQSSL